MKNIIWTIISLSCCLIAQDQKPEVSETENLQNLQDFEQFLEEEYANRGDNSQSSMIWKKPLIIDDNNHDFDNISEFTFSNNIIYKPDQNYTYPWMYNNYPAAIIVNKDNVTINLNGHNLSLDPSSAANFKMNSPIYGIAIYQGVKNLRIISSSPNGHNEKTHQGSITNFCGYAIYGSGSTQSYNSYDPYSNRIKNLMIDNLLITHNINGIFLENAITPNITNTNIIYNYSPRILYGIYYSNVLSGNIENCIINQNWSYLDVFGVYLQDTTNMSVSNCQASVNRSLKTGNATGFWLGSSYLIKGESSANTITNCTADRNLCSFSDNARSIGFHTTNLSHHNIITQNQSFNSGHTLQWPGIPNPTTLPTGTGFQWDSSDFNQVSYNKAGYHLTYGFYDSAPISSSFFTANNSIFNLINYHIIMPNLNASPGPLEVIVLLSNDVSAFTGAGPQLSNLSMITP